MSKGGIRFICVTLMMSLWSCERVMVDRSLGVELATSQAQLSDNEPMEKVVKTDEEWRAQLTEDQFRIARKDGTERPFGPYYKAFNKTQEENNHQGVWSCVCCGQPLFKAETSFDSGSGWPSFYEPFDENAVIEHKDSSLGMVRTEVVCKRCDAHLGHVFPDGYGTPTGQRYCINGAVIAFSQNGE